MLKQIVFAVMLIVSGISIAQNGTTSPYSYFGIGELKFKGTAENRSMAKKMIKKGGLLTEFLPGTRPERENFPKRNRIVAGMSDATIVVESKISGGSLITAYLANSYDRDVFAFPGDINLETSQGCNALISQEKVDYFEKLNSKERDVIDECFEKN